MNVWGFALVEELDESSIRVAVCNSAVGSANGTDTSEPVGNSKAAWANLQNISNHEVTMVATAPVHASAAPRHVLGFRGGVGEEMVGKDGAEACALCWLCARFLVN